MTPCMTMHDDTHSLPDRKRTQDPPEVVAGAAMLPTNGEKGWDQILDVNSLVARRTTQTVQCRELLVPPLVSTGR